MQHAGHKIGNVLTWMVLVSLQVACKSGGRADARRPAPTSPAAAATSSPPAGAAALAASATAPAPSAVPLPRLKPISTEPYPDGPSDEVLCAAIHSTESDIWERFGHFIPLFVDGVIWVGEGNDADRKATEKAIASYAPGTFYAEGRTCSTGGTLYYQPRRGEEYFDSLQNRYTLTELEAAALKANPIVKKTMAQKFVFSGKSGLKNIQGLCAVDANQCERLIRLNHKSSLCYSVLALADDRFARGERRWAKDPNAKLDRAALSKACEALAPKDKVCVMLTTDEGDEDRCWSEIAGKLGL